MTTELTNDQLHGLVQTEFRNMADTANKNVTAEDFIVRGRFSRHTAADVISGQMDNALDALLEDPSIEGAEAFAALVVLRRVAERVDQGDVPDPIATTAFVDASILPEAAAPAPKKSNRRKKAEPKVEAPPAPDVEPVPAVEDETSREVLESDQTFLASEPETTPVDPATYVEGVDPVAIDTAALPADSTPVTLDKADNGVLDLL